MNNYNSSSSEVQDFEFLDILAIISFIVQIQNIEEDKKEKDYIHSFIKEMRQEMQQLHRENKVILQLEEKLIELLKKEGTSNGID